MGKNLGKIIRLNDDGSIPKNNPFADQGGVTAQIWSLGHRNPLGLAFDSEGRLWNQELGPRHGDELNLLIKGKITATQQFLMATTMTGEKFQITILAQNLKHPKPIGCQQFQLQV